MMMSAGDAPRPARKWAWLGWVWALLPLAFALPAPVTFGWAAQRLRSRALAMEALVYLGLCVTWVTLANQHTQSLSNAGAILAIATAGVACAHGLLLRRRLVDGRVQAPPMPAAAPAASDALTTWTPSFPAHQVARDPTNPATWVTPVACTGTDRHQLSVPVTHTIWAGAAGLVLLGLDVHFHIYGRGLGTGIGLLVLPAFAALFNRWVDGPVLYYRTWGQLHQLRLDAVTAVTTGSSRAATTSIALASPGLDKPVRVSLRARGYVMPPAARDHLRGWLSSPAVQWSPQARQLFDAHTLPETRNARQRHRSLALVVGVVLPAALVAAGVYLAVERNAARHISGAPGYNRFGGPHGKLLAVGRPWGQACQPLRFIVDPTASDAVYEQVVTVITEARRDGLNVTLESRAFSPTTSSSSLYYPPGLGPASVPTVGIYPHWENPPHLANGQPEHIGLGWNAMVDPDGKHEDLTYAKGDLWMQVVNGHPQEIRRSVRQLVAMTQGIISTSRDDSGIARDTATDEFTPADVAAMQLMSGCNGAAAPIVSAAP